MPKANKIKRVRALKAQKMNEVKKSRSVRVQEIDSISAASQTNIEFPSTSRIEIPEVQNISAGSEIDTDKCAEAHTPVQEVDDQVDSSNILNIEAELTSPETSQIDGRRIVDIKYFFDQLKQIANHGPLNCGLNCIDIVNEKKIGLRSKFTLLCKMCNVKFFIENDPPGDLDVNRRAVGGIISIGCGHSQLEEFSAALDLPLMSSKLYQDIHEQISTQWETVALETMNKAADLERNLAIAEGRKDKDGVAIIDVIVDGCWSKRTYKKNYSALSGAAAIIGKRSGQILYLGVKNKYCCICAQAEKKGVEPKEHTCYKNYSSSSTSMESAILVEGFKTSIEMHNLIYGRMVSDGDSSTYAKLLQSRPYPHVTVEKIECRNHLLRNLCNKLENMKTDTKYLLRHRKLVTTAKILTIRKTIRKMINRYKSDSETQRKNNVDLLYNDLLLVHLHAFGNHTKCKSYFCTEKSEDVDNDGLFTGALWMRICLLIANLARHSTSLIHDVDSNVVERYNSIVAKFVGGKRVNYSLRGSYQNRCNAAVVSFNTHKVMSSLYKSLIGSSPRGKIRTLEQRRIKKLKLMETYQRKKKKIMFTTSQDEDYGEKCIKPDMPEDVYEREKNVFLLTLQKSKEEREKIQKETILQSGSSEWMELRRQILTASNFGRIIKRRGDVSCSNLIKKLLYKQLSSDIPSLKHGRENEHKALRQLAEEMNVDIKTCGLFIDGEKPYLGATPDGIVDENMIVEVKCPITAYKLGLDEAVLQKKITFYKRNNDGELHINKNHDWYFQIQGQLEITKAQKCLFGIWYGEKNKIKTEIIERDETFWKDKMEKKLTDFYFDCLLPELVDPRYTRSMPIRDPEYITKAIEEKKRKKTDTVKENTICLDRTQESEMNIIVNDMENNDDKMCSHISNITTESLEMAESKDNEISTDIENTTNSETFAVLGERQLQFSEF